MAVIAEDEQLTCVTLSESLIDKGENADGSISLMKIKDVKNQNFAL